MDRGDEIWECPFCCKKSIAVWRIPAHREFKSSRGSGQSSSQNFIVPEKVTVMVGCKECGKTKKQVQDKFEGKLSDEELADRCVWCKKPCPEGKSQCGACGVN